MPELSERPLQAVLALLEPVQEPGLSVQEPVQALVSAQEPGMLLQPGLEQMLLLSVLLHPYLDAFLLPLRLHLGSVLSSAVRMLSYRIRL